MAQLTTKLCTCHHTGLSEHQTPQPQKLEAPEKQQAFQFAVHSSFFIAMTYGPHCKLCYL